MIPSDLVVDDKLLQKVINMTTSDQAGEAINGARQTIRLMKDRRDVWKHGAIVEPEVNFLSKCHVNKSSCPLLSRVSEKLLNMAKSREIKDAEQFLSMSLGMCQRSLPCLNCRDGESYFKSVSTVRLGKVERNILRGLLDQSIIKIRPEDFTSRSHQESWYRAVKKLAKYKIIVRESSAIHRTVLGAKVIEICRTEINKNLPIRWDVKIKQLIRENIKSDWALLGDLRADLLLRFESLSYKDPQLDYIRNALNALDWVMH